jgi:hypothetical protein
MPCRGHRGSLENPNCLPLSTIVFNEGFDTLDLKEAKALLGELHT